MLTADANGMRPPGPARRVDRRSLLGNAAAGDALTHVHDDETANPIRLLLVDDKLLAREGIRALLSEQPGLRVVAQAASVAEAAALDVQPDVVITDLVLPDARGGEVVRRLRSHFGRAAILVLADLDHGSEVEGVVAAGVGGYVLKTASTLDFLHGIRTVAQGTQYLHPGLRCSGSGSPGPAEAGVRVAVDSLTANERNVMRLLVLGHTNAEIAHLCNVSLRTVEARRARVLQKLGVRTRAELVRVAKLAGDDIDDVELD